MTGEIAQLFNRTKKDLSVMYDGRRFILKPGLNAVPAEIVPHAKRQCRIMGTEDPTNPLDFETLVGVPDVDDCSPTEQSKKVEALDRKLMADPKSRAAKVTPTGRGLSRNIVAGDDLPEAAGFAAERR